MPETTERPADVQLDASDRRRLRHLRSRGGDAPDTISNTESYWRRTLAVAYLDLLDDLAADDPKLAAEMSGGAPLLVDRVRLSTDDPWRSDLEFYSYQAYSWAVRASCCRLAGRLRDADFALAQALDVVERGGNVALWARGEIMRRRAILLAHVAGPDVAFQAAEDAVDLCREADFKPGVADSLILLGALLAGCGEAGKACACNVAALSLVEGSGARATRTRTAVVINLAQSLSECGDLKQLKQAALALRQELKKTRHREQRGRILWAIGRIELRMGATRSAARRFRSAVRQLAESSDPTLIRLAEDCLRARDGFSQADLIDVLRLLDQSAVGHELPEAVEAWNDAIIAYRFRQSSVSRPARNAR
ncbi:MAG: hypothetical protein AAGC60_29460 [Acidobacteriota bacterium]